tara:strand:- start:365 stop:502 length:138 start_codon:yes stop_codon:yes gene_type:complete
MIGAFIADRPSMEGEVLVDRPRASSSGVQVAADVLSFSARDNAIA